MRKWVKIQEDLNQPIPGDLIMPARADLGIYGDWIKGSVAIELANKLFGPDGWSTRIASGPTVTDVTIGIGEGGQARHGVTVGVVVEVTVVGLDENDKPITVTRQDVGWGTATESWDSQSRTYMPLKPAQIRSAYMGSVTIGVKRCLHQLGRALGLQLYVPDEEQMAALWEVPAVVEEGKAPAPKLAPMSVAGLARQLGVEITDANKESLGSLMDKMGRLAELGKTPVSTKKVVETIGQGKSISDVFLEMPSYAAWMASEGDKQPQSGTAFVNVLAYDQLARQIDDLMYRLQGGDYEPWPNAGVHNPVMMVGYRIEKAALSNDEFVQNLVGRFPDESGEAVNGYHMMNHFKGHFQVERIALLTWEQLAAFRAHIADGSEYPQTWRKQQVQQQVAEEPAEPVVEEPAEPMPLPDYYEMSVQLLDDIDKTLELPDGVSAVALAQKLHPLNTEPAYNVVQALANAVKGGNVKQYNVVETILKTALSGLPAVRGLSEDEGGGGTIRKTAPSRVSAVRGLSVDEGGQDGETS